MTIASYQTLKQCNPIVNMVEKTVEHGMSYGLSMAGYDIRIDQEVDLPPHGFALASSMELFETPPHLMGFVHDKSSWLRKGLIAGGGVIEPGWVGYLTLELSNRSDKHIHIPKGCPIAQIIYHHLDEAAAVTYSGKYQNQKAGPKEAIYEQRRA